MINDGSVLFLSREKSRLEELRVGSISNRFQSHHLRQVQVRVHDDARDGYREQRGTVGGPLHDVVIQVQIFKRRGNILLGFQLDRFFGLLRLQLRQLHRAGEGAIGGNRRELPG